MKTSRRHGTGIFLLAALGVWGCGAEARSENAADATPIEVASAPTATVEDRAADLAQGLVEEPLEVKPVVEPTPVRTEPVVARRPAPSTPPAAEPDPGPRTSEPMLVSTAVEGSIPEAPPEPIPAVFEGTVFEVSLDTELSTHDHLIGDVFWATLVEDLRAENGEVLVPAGAGVRGVITESLPSPDADEPALLEFEFDAILVQGRELPLESVVVFAPVETSTRDSGGESVVKVVGGAAAGAILGRILGGSKSDAAKGAVVGAAAGGAVAAGTRDGHAKVPAGAVVELELMRSFRLIS